MRLASLVAVLLVASAQAGAQSPAASGPMPGMKMPAPATPDTPSTTAYKAAMAKMDRGMAVAYSGNPDRDFVAGMIPHHDGAIDMARVELLHGKDPAMRKLAQEIIGAQQKEIALMQKWQASHPN